MNEEGMQKLVGQLPPAVRDGAARVEIPDGWACASRAAEIGTQMRGEGRA